MRKLQEQVEKDERSVQEIREHGTKQLSKNCKLEKPQERQLNNEEVMKSL